MKYAIIGLVLANIILAAHADGYQRKCNPEKSKPCGMSCIRKEFTCHKTPGDAQKRPKVAR